MHIRKALTAGLLVVIFASVLVGFTIIAANEEIVVVIDIDKDVFKGNSIRGLGGKVLYVAESAPIAIVKIPSVSLHALSKVSGILHVSLDGEVYSMRVDLLKPEITPPGKPGATQPPQVIPWGIDRINASEAWTYGNTRGFVDINGDGDSEIEIAIIDTGIDKDHPDLVSNIKWCIATLNGRISTRCTDRNGHGTHVSGTVAALDNDIGVVGVAPEVEIYVIKALSDGGIGSWSDLIIAIDQAIKGPDGVIDSDGDGVIVGDPEDDAAEVISMSLGGSSPPQELHDIIAVAYNYGITIVAAAGNDGAESPSYPAAYSEVIAVGATDQNDLVPDWSNRNPEVAAPGVSILSTYPDDTYEELSGTSMATPHVSGTVALIQAARLTNGLTLLPPGTETDETTSTIRGLLHVTADDIGSDGYDSLYGYGIIRADLAVNGALSN